MRIYALKSCDTCRKAIAALRTAGLDPQVIDIRADGIAPADLTAILSQCEAAALNRASTTWRTLSEADRARPAADLIADHPLLLKRPAIERDGQWTVGWSKPVQSGWLG